MLSFEDFFIKKKIDLPALKAADQPLYDEFKSHYLIMGEKSFDHSKKFWFNRLRKTYLLKEIENLKVSTSGISKINEPIVSSAEIKVTDITVPKPLGFKPKIKTDTVAKPQVSPNTEELNAKPAGFKPRFKAGVTKATEATAQDNTASQEAKPSEVADAQETANKPAGFKPRFKAGITKNQDNKNEN